MSRSTTEQLAELDARVAKKLPVALAGLREARESLSETIATHAELVKLATEDQQLDVAEYHLARFKELSEMVAEIDQGIDRCARILKP